MVDDNERREWTDLTQSPGWSRLVALAQAEWTGAAFVAQVERLTDKPDDAMSLAQLRQMMAAKRAVERVLNLPKERLNYVARQTAADEANSHSRRGPL
jgi:hypothetical protein